ncbi:4-amino-4-deoxy-L-arabinose transferase-like glycosyltransferase [Streptosporangium becharense]|uniref:4-amino-4-deoxy-L-arabinose transferase-like glycosyltransferase n=1 Tax=Streptosporangium becharense TaxID=1816182 RepID=A0A7W9IKZ0_9ACTN|nr:glycosyltransferase family 39 protein [Streptosporangium becharense]MBB2911522.1 4-amino-4-deoxy-L-arabinose transferase-like glycosyltransferase [Streptosporangium becharense]MBB5822660.1 4-amino-4-deoxy-L-arabinose transferase-like glycosyltransferase [Streptosporangium becharense]
MTIGAAHDAEPPATVPDPAGPPTAGPGAVGASVTVPDPAGPTATSGAVGLPSRTAGAGDAARRVFLGRPGDPRWARPALWGVLALAAVLHLWGLGQNGHANDYYSAAILSGTRSWKAFFFGALDAGSFITVDKPPFALWVMGLSARIFGFGTWSMLVPQALAGVAAVAVVHSAVRRALPGGYGHAAASVAALVMTLTPITVAIDRDNNPDTVLVLLLVLAAWFCQEATRTGRLRALLTTALLVGLAFNTKMLQAYLVLPAFTLVHLAMAPGTPWRRLGRLSAAGAVLVAASGWWMVIVDLWPASSRPYVGGSTDNSVRDLVVGYNGLGRIFGGGGPGGGRGGGFGGEPGAGRLFNDIMAGQISWLLPFAVLALVAGLVLTVRRPLRDARGTRAALLLWGGWLAVHYAVFSFSSGTFHPYYTTAMAPAVAALTGLGGTLLWRAYRDSPVWSWVLPAGIAVTGAWAFTVLRRTEDFVPWLAWAVAGVSAAAVAGLVLARLGHGLRTRVAAVALTAGTLAALAGPAAYALTPLGSPVNGTNPTAGPAGSGPGFGGMRGRFPGGARPDGTDQVPGDGDLPAGAGQDAPEGVSGGAGQPSMPTDGPTDGPVDGPVDGMRGGPGGAVDQRMIEYLRRNRGSATWLVAVGSAQSASSVILSTGLPVIAMGGFTGGDPAMTVDRLASLVSSGRLRYVMTGGGRGGPGGGGDTGVTEWVRANCTAVVAAEYGGATGQSPLYRCG